RGELYAAEGLGERGPARGLEEVADLVGDGVAGHEGEAPGGGGRLLLEPVVELATVEARHADVAKDQVELAGARERESFLARRGRRDLAAEVLEHAADRTLEPGLVVDHEHTQPGVRRLGRCGARARPGCWRCSRGAGLRSRS